MIIRHSYRINSLCISNALTLSHSFIKLVIKRKSPGKIRRYRTDKNDKNLKLDEKYVTMKSKTLDGLASLKKLKNIIPKTAVQCLLCYCPKSSSFCQRNLGQSSYSKTRCSPTLTGRARSIWKKPGIRVTGHVTG